MMGVCSNSQSFQQKMVDFTFEGLFMTTNKGIPDLDNLPTSISLAKPYYIYSILIQTFLLLFFILYFALSIFRVYKKIKNPNFEDVIDHDEATNKNPTEKADNGKENENEKEDKLIYQFDDEEEQEEEQKEKDANQNEIEKSENLKNEDKEKEEAKEDNFDEYHDENEQSFIELDRKLLFLSPFLVPFIVCNSLFAADPLTVILLVLTLVCYILFNLKKKLENIKIMQFLFMIFSLLAFISFFYNDHDLTT